METETELEAPEVDVPETDDDGEDQDEQEVELEAQDEDDDLEDGETEPDESDPELVEVEYGGRKYKVAPELRDQFMMREDYTRKTQEVAAQRKALEAEQTNMAERAKIEAELGDDIQKVRQIDAELEQFSQVNWPELQQEDPNMHSALLARFTTLKHSGDRMRGEVAAKIQDFESRTQREAAERQERTKAEIRTAIPDWNEQKESEIFTFANSLGFDDAAVRSAVYNDAKIAKVLDLAKFGQQVLNQRKKPKPARPEKAEPGPLPQLKGKASHKRGPSDRQSTDQWMKARNRELNQRRSA